MDTASPRFSESATATRLDIRQSHPPLPLRPETVSTIQTFGGTMLGTSRGPQKVTEMVDALEQLGINILL